MEWTEWRDRYQEAIKALVGCNDQDALHCADAARDTYDEDPDQDPEEAASEDVSYWDDDGQ